MPHTAVIYARISTDEQDLDLQLQPLRRFAKQRKWKVVAQLTDIGSGAKNNRPNYQKLGLPVFLWVIFGPFQSSGRKAVKILSRRYSSSRRP